MAARAGQRVQVRLEARHGRDEASDLDPLAARATDAAQEPTGDDVVLTTALVEQREVRQEELAEGRVGAEREGRRVAHRGRLNAALDELELTELPDGIVDELVGAQVPQVPGR